MSQLHTQLDYLIHLERFEKVKLGLDNMRRLLSSLDNPHTKFPTIHIAGTNGKSSTAAILDCILKEAGYKTGLYTSPHLIEFNERVRVNGHPVPNSELSRHIARVRSAAKASHTNPTFFEFTTALAFNYFAEQEVDIAIIEVGMGGDLDATNVVTPLLSIITNVSTDHQQWLGKTKPAIARRKAGVIKSQIPLVTAETNPRILDIFNQVAAQHHSPVLSVPKLIQASRLNSHHDSQTFTTTGLYQDSFTLSLRGRHQITNALTALTALSHLPTSLPVTIDQIKTGLSQVHWPGRLDLISRQPFILVDGAHNQEGFQYLIQYLKYSPLPAPGTVILGLKKDKHFNQEIIDLTKLFKHVIITEAKYNPLPAADLAGQIKPHHSSVQTIPDLATAIKEAKQKSRDSMLLITGSLYLVGDTMATLKIQPHR